VLIRAPPSVDDSVALISHDSRNVGGYGGDADLCLGYFARMSLTLDAEQSGPHVHLDSLAQTRWLVETLDIIEADGRASRAQQHHVFGGFKAANGSVVIYAGAQENLVSLRITGEAFQQLRSTLSSPQS
jgi:hypothetical protein